MFNLNMKQLSVC